VAARPIDTTSKLADVVRKALGHRVGAPFRRCASISTANSTNSRRGLKPPSAS
jgi:hypothetical protein